MSIISLHVGEHILGFFTWQCALSNGLFCSPILVAYVTQKKVHNTCGGIGTILGPQCRRRDWGMASWDPRRNPVELIPNWCWSYILKLKAWPRNHPGRNTHIKKGSNIVGIRHINYLLQVVDKILVPKLGCSQSLSVCQMLGILTTLMCVCVLVVHSWGKRA